MPLWKKKQTVKIEDGEKSIEKSLSSPEILERGKESVTDRNNVMSQIEFRKEKKISWFRRLVPKFRRRRRTTEVVSNSSECFPIQKSSSCQFYTPPPKEFLEKVIKETDDEEKDIKNSEESNQSAECVDGKALLQTSFRRAPLPLNVALINELKTSLKQNNNDADEDNIEEKPVYSNVADLSKNMGSSRKKQKSNSDGYKYTDLEGIYERTWVDTGKISDSVDALPTEPYYSQISKPEPQPIKPLHKFAKPKPPVNRKPSSRRNSKPEVLIRKKSLKNAIAVTERRSNAELDEIIKNLQDIPPPNSDAHITVPTPKKRTIFNREQQPQDVIQPSTKTPVPLNPSTNKTSTTNTLLIIPDQVKVDENTSFNRTYSFPRSKIKCFQNEKMKINDISCTFDEIKNKSGVTNPSTDLEHKTFKRWNTLPHNYILKHGLANFHNPIQYSQSEVKLKNNKSNESFENADPNKGNDSYRKACLLAKNYSGGTGSFSKADAGQVEVIKGHLVESLKMKVDIHKNMPLNTYEDKSEVSSAEEENFQENENKMVSDESLKFQQLLGEIRNDNSPQTDEKTYEDIFVNKYFKKSVKVESIPISHDNNESNVELIDGKTEAIYDIPENVSIVNSNFPAQLPIKNHSEMNVETSEYSDMLSLNEPPFIKIVDSVNETIAIGMDKAPVKPQRITSQPSKTIKPELPPKHPDFVRRGGVRLKRYTVSDERSSAKDIADRISSSTSLNSMLSENSPEENYDVLQSDAKFEGDIDHLKKRRSQSIY